MRTLLVLAISAACASAQIKISGLDGLAAKAKEVVDVNLDSSMLQLAGGFLTSNKPEDAKVKAMILGLKGIFVKSFEFDKEGEYKQSDLEPIRAQLRGPGWNRIVNVKDKDETTEIYTKSDQGKVTGFAILAAEPKELTVVTIEGSINLADLASLGGHLGIPVIPVH